MNCNVRNMKHSKEKKMMSHRKNIENVSPIPNSEIIYVRDK